jgi:hypothetical protein
LWQTKHPTSELTLILTANNLPVVSPVCARKLFGEGYLKLHPKRNGSTGSGDI